MPMKWSMIDVASKGALVDKSLEHAQNLISNMEAHSPHFSCHREPSSSVRKVNNVNTSCLDQQIANLTSLVQQLATGNT